MEEFVQGALGRRHRVGGDERTTVGVDLGYFRDAFEVFQCLFWGHGNGGGAERAEEDAAEQERQHAVEGMDADVVVGPVKHGEPGNATAVLGNAEHVLDAVLSVIGLDDGAGNCLVPSVLASTA